MFDLEAYEVVWALSDVARGLEADPYLRGAACGIQGALPSLLGGEKLPPPPAVSIPVEWAGSADGVTWSQDARAYARGFEAGWAAVVAVAPEGVPDMGAAVIEFGRVLAEVGALVSSADAFDYAERPWKWGWSFGVWEALKRPTEGAPFLFFAAVCDALDS